MAVHDEQTVADVLRLRSQLERMQRSRLDAPALPTHPALAELLPGGGLKPGSTYALSGSMPLLLALLAGPSQDGEWCAAIGMPELGAEAAERMGVDLSRLVLVPDPGPRWLAVAATIAEVIPVVAVRPQSRAGDAEVSRLAARLRDRGAVLLVEGPWPEAQAMISVEAERWPGLGAGHGYLSGCEATVTVSSRRSPVPRSARMLLPGPDGRVAALAPHRLTVLPGPDSVPALGPVPALRQAQGPREGPEYEPLEAVG